jgi:dipeptidyl aminopeptidase/acylaminoacyl peptidase
MPMIASFLIALLVAGAAPQSGPVPPPPPGTEKVVSFDRHGERLAVCAQESGGPIAKEGRMIPRTQVYIATKDVISRTTLGLGACDPVWSPDGSKLAVVTPEGLWVLARDLQTGERITDAASVPDAKTMSASVAFSKPRWAPDGRMIGFVATDGGTSWVEVVDAATGKRLFKSDSEVYAFSWASDSRSIVIGGRTIRVP